MTVRLEVPLIPPPVAVITVEPRETPVAKPLAGLIVAIVVLAEDQANTGWGEKYFRTGPNPWR